MIYAIQEGLFRGNHEERLVNTLRRFDFDVHFFKHIPFTKELQWIQVEHSELKNAYRTASFMVPVEPPKGKNVMAFGSVRFSHFAHEFGWKPGSFYNDNHDYRVYSEHYRENMLNWDSRIQRLADPVEEEFFFARPTGDTKTFKGETYGKKMWEFCVDVALTNGADPNELVQICSPKEIMQEIRCFVVKGKVITASFYKFGDRVAYQECFDEDILSFAQEMVDHFQLADAFVIDVCRTDKGLKVVECGCINCCGFYDINEQKLIEALEASFDGIV
jgi:hypothetical protein